MERGIKAILVILLNIKTKCDGNGPDYILYLYTPKGG